MDRVRYRCVSCIVLRRRFYHPAMALCHHGGCFYDTSCNRRTQVVQVQTRRLSSRKKGCHSVFIVIFSAIFVNCDYIHHIHIIQRALIRRIHFLCSFSPQFTKMRRYPVIVVFTPKDRHRSLSFNVSEVHELGSQTRENTIISSLLHS
jgi:hypothetical protein